MKKYCILLPIVMAVMSFISCKNLTGDENQKQKSPAGVEDQTNESPEMLYAKQYKEYLESIPALETKGTVKWAGLRYSPYGVKRDTVSGKRGLSVPENDEWQKYISTLTGIYEESTGIFILIPATISTYEDEDGKTINYCSFNFTKPSGVTVSDTDLFSFAKEDLYGYEDFLTMCDEKGYSVWLQAEPGDNDLSKIATVLLKKYGSHKCVKGYGIDLEWWYPIDDEDLNEGSKIDDETAKAVVETVRSFNESYTVFTKHWDERFMPPTYRDGMIFVNDSQIYESLEVMVSDFTNWARYFQGSPVFFQIGYEADYAIWKNDPLATAKAITDSASEYNKEIGLIWVDFTMRSALDRY